MLVLLESLSPEQRAVLLLHDVFDYEYPDIAQIIGKSADNVRMVLFWQYGWGSQAIFGIHATGAITFWIPLMVFAFLYGLSMDYEVFILSRIREEYDGARSTNAAVIEGMGRTGRLVTSAALILFLAFAALASGPGTDLKTLATGLGFGILLDATLVRCLLVPSLVSLFGRWNWYLPARFARVLRVQPSHPHPERPEPREPEPAPSAEPAGTSLDTAITADRLLSAAHELLVRATGPQPGAASAGVSRQQLQFGAHWQMVARYADVRRVDRLGSAHGYAGPGKIQSNATGEGAEGL
jgi:MMPL family/Sigma-70, region 4